jgi:hypothetical protein
MQLMAKLTDFKRGDKVQVNGDISHGRGKVLGFVTRDLDAQDDYFDTDDTSFDYAGVKQLLTAWLKGYKKPAKTERLLRVELDDERKFLYNVEDLAAGKVKRLTPRKAAVTTKKAKTTRPARTAKTKTKTAKKRYTSKKR